MSDFTVLITEEDKEGFMRVYDAEMNCIRDMSYDEKLGYCQRVLAHSMRELDYSFTYVNAAIPVWNEAIMKMLRKEIIVRMKEIYAKYCR